MPTRNVNLTPHFDQFIENGITSGRFSNASEIVREGLRLLEQREAEDKARLEWLRSSCAEAFAALDRGEGMVLNSADDVKKFVDDVLQEVLHEHSRN